MAIKIGGTSIIDDNKNISNVGIVTIGASSSGKLNVGSGVTATGDGTISIAGTIYAFDVVTPLKIDSFSPSDGAVNVIPNSDIRITFDRAIGIGSTGYVRIRVGSASVQTFGIGSTLISRTDLNRTLVITPSPPLTKGSPGVGSTIITSVDAKFINDSSFLGINTTGSNVTYQFTMQQVNLGDSYAGGYFICGAGGTQWIVSPSSAEVSRNWYDRDNANTLAQQVSGCTGWFIPTCGQLQNPGYTCRVYWDNYSRTVHWSSTEYPAPGAPCFARRVDMNTGVAPFDSGNNKGNVYCVRSFRCVTY